MHIVGIWLQRVNVHRTILFGQSRRWSVWLNRVSVFNQTLCTLLVYLYIEVVYTRVITSGEARSMSHMYIFNYHSLWDNGTYKPLLLVTRYVPFVAIPLLPTFQCFVQ